MVLRCSAQTGPRIREPSGSGRGRLFWLVEWGSRRQLTLFCLDDRQEAWKVGRSRFRSSISWLQDRKSTRRWSTTVLVLFGHYVWGLRMSCFLAHTFGLFA